MNAEWPSLAAMTDQWATEISLDKLVAALSNQPDPVNIAMACKAAFVDGAIRMLEVTDKRMKRLHEMADA